MTDSMSGRPTVDDETLTAGSCWIWEWSVEERSALEAVRSDEVVSRRLWTEKGLTEAEVDPSETSLGLGLADSRDWLFERWLTGVAEGALVR